MTIGKKIRYLRSIANMTQAELAKNSDIFITTIRKYEADQVIPQLPQVRKLAKALNVSTFAIAGINSDFAIDTFGDLCGLFIILYKMKILVLKGKRDDNGYLDINDISISFSPLYNQILSSEVSQNISDLVFGIKSPIFKKELADILKWEKLYSDYLKFVDMYSDDKVSIEFLNNLSENLDCIELELQRCPILLDTSNGIKIKISPQAQE